MREIGDRFIIVDLGYPNEVFTCIGIEACGEVCYKCNVDNKMLYKSKSFYLFCEKYLRWLD